jgi:cell division protein FtsZ
MTTDMIKFDLPKNQSSIIKVIGVGGGGSNAVNHMFRQGIEGVDFVVCNTDRQALEMSPVPNKMQLGVSLTDGRGAGSIPEVGRNAAIEDLERVKEILETNTKMLFITAGMGGGTGTGAAPVIAKASKELGILTVAIVTIPFAFEGRKRRQQAEAGINDLKENVDTLLIICNDRLRELYGNLSVSDAFSHADNVLTTAAKGIAEIITLTGNINVDFADVRTVMSDSGVAIMGSGSAEGENRAIKAVEMALSSPLLNDNKIKGANNILLNITSGKKDEVRMDEISEITDYIQIEAGSTAEIIWGLGIDDELDKRINVTLVATGFEAGNHLGLDLPSPQKAKKVITLDVNSAEKTQETRRKVTEEIGEITLINKKEETKEAGLTFEFDLTPRSESKIQKEAQKPAVSTGHNNTISEEDLHKKVQEREKRLRALSIQLKTPEGLDDLEKQPAYLRRNVVLSKVSASNESQVSRFTLKEGENAQSQIKSNNSFLHDNVD